MTTDDPRLLVAIGAAGLVLAAADAYGLLVELPSRKKRSESGVSAEEAEEFLSRRAAEKHRMRERREKVRADRLQRLMEQDADDDRPTLPDFPPEDVQQRRRLDREMAELERSMLVRHSREVADYMMGRRSPGMTAAEWREMYGEPDE